MRIIRSLQNVSGDLTITDGDLILDGDDQGIQMENNNGDPQRITVIEHEGVNTVQVTEA